MRYIVNKSYRIDVSTFEMTKLPKLVWTRHSIAAVRAGEYLYAFGGVDSKGKASREIERLKVSSSSGCLWTKLEYKISMDDTNFTEVSKVQF